MLLGVLVNTLYIKETENGQVTFFVLLALLPSEQYFRIRALLHPPTITDRHFHNDLTTFFQTNMQFFLITSFIFTSSLQSSLINLTAF